MIAPIHRVGARMAVWSEITRQSEADDPWRQARAADRRERRRCHAAALAELPAWRQAVRAGLADLRKPPPDPTGALKLGILWARYRDAQRRARIWERWLTRPAAADQAASDRPTAAAD
jgi:hypothetical protein